MADVPATLRAWSATTANNTPTDATTIGAGLADNLQEIQAVTRRYLASKGSNMASASTVDLSTADGYFIDITGTTTITSFGTEQSGISYKLRFTGTLTLTYNATSMITPSAVSIVTSNGDTCMATSLGSGNWLITQYEKKGASQLSPSGALPTVGGTANAITLAHTIPVTGYFDGLMIRFIPTSSNTGTTSVNVDGLGVKSVQVDGAAARGFDWPKVTSGTFGVVQLVYSSSAFHIINPQRRVLLVANSFGMSTSSVVAGDFSTAVTAVAFDFYEMEIVTAFNQSGNTTLLESSSNGGSSYLSNCHVYMANYANTNAVSTLSGVGSGSGATTMILSPTSLANTSVPGSVRLKYKPSSTYSATNSMFTWQGQCYDGSGYAYNIWGAGLSSSATNAFRISPGSGSFEGTIKLWGVR